MHKAEGVTHAWFKVRLDCSQSNCNSRIFGKILNFRNNSLNSGYFLPLQTGLLNIFNEHYARVVHRYKRITWSLHVHMHKAEGVTHAWFKVRLDCSQSNCNSRIFGKMLNFRNNILNSGCFLPLQTGLLNIFNEHYGHVVHRYKRIAWSNTPLTHAYVHRAKPWTCTCGRGICQLSCACAWTLRCSAANLQVTHLRTDQV